VKIAVWAKLESATTFVMEYAVEGIRANLHIVEVVGETDEGVGGVAVVEEEEVTTTAETPEEMIEETRIETNEADLASDGSAI